MLLNSTEIFGTPTLLVMDPIHGGISFFSHEKQIIDHPLFQRLRHIKQTDVLNFVFPGATHSRFEHCLGTMYVAGKIFRKMISNYIGTRREITLDKDQIAAIQYLYGCLRTAALLHDVGHMPFSHQFEDSPVGKHLLKDENIISKLLNDGPREHLETVPGELNHEHYSICCACKILKDVISSNSFPFEIGDIIGMMEGAKHIPSAYIPVKVKETIKLISTVPELVESFSEGMIIETLYNLFKDIISGEVDADKMDYLLRDSYFSGSKYGAYNIDHLVQNMRLGFSLNTDPPWVGIAINQKGLGALEDFVYSRFRMYLQVYNHKTVVGFKWLIRVAISEILQESNILRHIKEALSDLNVFVNFTDTFFWEAFRKLASEQPDSACGYIVRRQRLSHITNITARPSFVINEKKESLKSELCKEIIDHQSSSRFSNINPSFDKIRLLVKDPITNKLKIEAIQEHSNFFARFENVVETHFYESPNFLRVER